jgi:hypothetical protein
MFQSLLFNASKLFSCQYLPPITLYECSIPSLSSFILLVLLFLSLSLKFSMHIIFFLTYQFLSKKTHIHDRSLRSWSRTLLCSLSLSEYMKQIRKWDRRQPKYDIKTPWNRNSNPKFQIWYHRYPTNFNEIKP